MADKRLFLIRLCGDPYSSHWEACEFEHSFDDRVAVYRGDLPHLSRDRLALHLRGLYPECIVRVER